MGEQFTIVSAEERAQTDQVRQSLFFDVEHEDDEDDDDFKWSHVSCKVLAPKLTAQACFLYLLSSGIIRRISSGKEELTMAEKKTSKTARASSGDKGNQFTGKHCPSCGGAMVATKFIKSEERPGGMYWVCHKDDQRIRI